MAFRSAPRPQRRERASERLPTLIAKAEEAIAKFEEDVKRAEAGEVVPAASGSTQPPAKPQQRGPRLPYREYRTSGGLEVRVGRSSRDNDELTLRHAAPNDIWMHAVKLLMSYSDADYVPAEYDRELNTARAVGPASPGHRRAAGGRVENRYLISFSRRFRYSICPRSASSPMPPVSGTFRASSSTSPLHVQWATFPFTTTTISFQSCGRYFVKVL